MEGWRGSVVALCLAGAVTITLYLYNILWLHPEKIRTKLRSQGIHGPPPSPLYGNIPDMKRIQQEEKTHREQTGSPYPADYSSALFPYFHRWRKAYGPLYVYSTGSLQVLHVSRPDIVKEIGHCRSLDLGKPTYMSRDLGALLGRGIVSSNGASWAHQRGVIAPELFMDKVKGMVGIKVEAAISLLKSWESIVENEGGTAEVAVTEGLRRFSADVISRACFGSNYSSGQELFSKIRDLQKAMSKTSLFIGIPGSRYLPTKNNQEIWRLNNEIRALILGLARERKSKPSDLFTRDLFQSIITGSSGGPDNASDFIVDNCKSIYFAGHDTASQTMAWCLMLLGSHLEWQDRVRAEVLEVCQGSIPDFDMLRKMKMLTMVIQETLRRYPAGTFVKRQATRDMKFGDVIIPKGVIMEISIAETHHDPEIWGPDADDFNPGRFSKGIAGACKHAHMYIPFGIGTRTCAGQNFAMTEMKILLSLVLSKFTFSLSPNYIHSPLFSLTIEPQYGVPLIMKKL